MLSVPVSLSNLWVLSSCCHQDGSTHTLSLCNLQSTEEQPALQPTQPQGCHLGVHLDTAHPSSSERSSLDQHFL